MHYDANAKEAIRDLYEMLRTPNAKHSTRKFCKKYLRDQYDMKPAKPLLSLQDAMRTRYDDNGESWTVYGFLSVDADQTDEQIRDELYGNYERTINSPYDCTGKPFTCHIHFKRISPTVITFAHCLGLDI